MADGTDPFVPWNYDDIQRNAAWKARERTWNRLASANQIDQLCADFFASVKDLLDDIELTRPVSDLRSEPPKGSVNYPHKLNWVDLALAGEWRQRDGRVCGRRPEPPVDAMLGPPDVGGAGGPRA